MINFQNTDKVFKNITVLEEKNKEIEAKNMLLEKRISELIKAKDMS